MHANGCYRNSTVAAFLSAITLTAATREACRYLPGDPKWPTEKDWSGLNRTIGGKLVLGTPLAQVCHSPNLNADACAETQNKWVLTET